MNEKEFEIKKVTLIQRLDKFTEKVAEYLGVESLPIVFRDDIVDESRLSLNNYARIEINKKFELNENECKKSIAHELRHAFQIYYAQLMNDELANQWRKELVNPKNSRNTNLDDPIALATYGCQSIEIDAEAFSQYYLSKYEGILMKKKDDWIQLLIDVYIDKYKDRF